MNNKSSFTLASLLGVLPLQAQWSLIDDMEGANNWIGPGVLAEDPALPGNQVFASENTGTRVENYLTLANPIPEGATATLFFRLRSTAPSGLVDWVVGTSDVAVPTNWPDFEGYLRFAEDGTVDDLDIDVRNGGGFSEVGPAPADTWINVWLVLNNSDDTTDVYFNTTPADATTPGTLSLIGSGFRNGTAASLITLLAINNEPGTTGYLDDLYLDLSGENLTYPFSDDTDGDGLSDSWEIAFFGDLSRDGSGDFDTDNLSDLEEFEEGTNPILADSDGDTLNDDVELSGSANPFDNAPTNPLVADSDGDGFDDNVEADSSTNPNDAASFPGRPTGFQLVEDFEGDGMIPGESFSGVNGWNTGTPGAATVFVEEDSSDQVGRLERTIDLAASNVVSKSLDDLALQIPEGGTGTLFLQISASSGTVDNSFGVSDLIAPNAFGSYEAQGVLYPGNILRVRDGGAFRDQGQYAANTWMNVWLVANNETDQLRIFVESPDGLDGVIEITDDGGIDPFDFRNGTSDRLASVLLITALGGEAGSFVLVDNIYLDPAAENLSAPVPSKGTANEIFVTSIGTNNDDDLVITFSPGGDGFILTTSGNLTDPFQQEFNAIFENGNTFRIPAANVSGSRRFFRVEKP